MPRFASLDDLIARKAKEYADQIKAAAAMADKEEEIRIESEKQLAFIQKEAGIKLEGKHEVTVASGRVDSVYSRVIIEYKNPKSPGDRIGPKADSPGSKKVVEQIKKRFYDMRFEQGQSLNSLFGVGLDGNYFVFIRFRDDKWQVQDPVEVNRVSAERFLWALFNLGSKGKAFTPEYLAGDFGSEGGNTIAIAGIHALYDAIVTTDNPKAQTFFSQWKILFGEVCGYDVDDPSDKIKKLADFYKVGVKKPKPAELLFAVHTYYALFMKLLAAEIVAFFHKLPTPLQKMMQATTSNKLKREMEDLEAGSIFRHLNITNFLEGDLFAWYVGVWTEPIEKLVRAMVSKLDDYNPGTLSEDPAGSRDLLKKLYQQLFPKSVRHDLGEYYTPDWLAEHVLNELGYVGDPDKRLLDPACGSGTFLVMAINRIREWYDANRERCRFDEGDLCRKILANVIGFDLNPLAVMAARTNYLIAIRDLIGQSDKVEIPVYLCDSILTPSEYGGLFTGTLGKAKALKTAPATFIIPTEIATNREDVAKYAEQLEFCVRNGYAPDEFIQRCRDEGLTVTSDSLHINLYGELVKLDKANKNGVWARIIKNAFAPLFIGQVDYVAGNPPWIVWDNLPADYRDGTKPLWGHYGLFTLSASAARHGGGKKDISMLMLYVSADRYLKQSGKLGFVITQTLFQTKGAGDGFRRFRIGTGTSLRILRVDDMVRFQPFEGASNWTSTIFLKKGQPTEYPVHYFKWKLVGELPDEHMKGWREQFTQDEYKAQPVDRERLTSPWLLLPKKAGASVGLLAAKAEYKGHAGAYSGGTNAVYWLRIMKRVGNDVLVQNITEKSKTHVEAVERTLEKGLLYPLIRWLDVGRYHANPRAYLLLVQDTETRSGIPEAHMRRTFPKTYSYLLQFKDILLKRGSSSVKKLMETGAFYSMFAIGSYTLAPVKVVWRRMDRQINAAVVSEVNDEYLGKRPVIPQETCVFVPCESPSEAHYLCAMLNSSVINFIAKSHSVEGGKGFGTPSMLDFLPIKRFNPHEPIHAELAELSREAHALTVCEKDISSIQRKIDSLVARVLEVSKEDLQSIVAAMGVD
jgi:hypothetical protein